MATLTTAAISRACSATRWPLPTGPDFRRGALNRPRAGDCAAAAWPPTSKRAAGLCAVGPGRAALRRGRRDHDVRGLALARTGPRDELRTDRLLGARRAD